MIGQLCTAFWERGSLMESKHLRAESSLRRARTERVYVKVISEFDATGYMQPLSITWADGRTFPIERVRDFRPAGMAGSDLAGDCFTVLIQGQEKLLFFEHVDPRFTGRLGRKKKKKTVTR